MKITFSNNECLDIIRVFESYTDEDYSLLVECSTSDSIESLHDKIVGGLSEMIVTERVNGTEPLVYKGYTSVNINREISVDRDVVRLNFRK